LELKKGRHVKEAGADIGMPEKIRNVWGSQARSDKNAFVPGEQKDLTARARDLEAENRRLELHRGAFKEATALFAREEDRP
jgi:transposase-like protein